MVMLMIKPAPMPTQPQTQETPNNQPQQQPTISNPIPTLNQPNETFVVNQQIVTNLTAMGFKQEDILPCLQASRNDEDLAVKN